MASKQLMNLAKVGRSGKNLLAAAASSTARNSSTRSDVDKVTHTGQVFEKDDYRNVRFTNAKRYVNENWGINLIDEVPPIESTERVVYCDGGNGPLGHPKVYINLDKPGKHICGYCGLRFIKKDTHH
ncbi:NADH dehydrogenase [ubiquinone] iron-sulfur protein 6, mitochondrial [Scaptodrosophila lebanonensis]|uniref:NADH dehydrogenase [ubiquinone] iron-sulfur protein 6, mitochondrial n=1 Tax=Drosophila lebanonensis TaxID=7225 RepID=A0A6J2U5F0_DROLE|nr:NADH dehydrogenase [ubiquinone] iron-sulfur protein 6, mitochondrial [Scaptodrosophila lebanonensis]